MFFGLFKKKAPSVLTPEMLKPVDTLISTPEAKRIFKEWMVNIGHLSDKSKLDKQELSEHINYLSDAIREHEQSLKDDLEAEKATWKEEIRGNKTAIKNEQIKLEKCTDPDERAETEEDIASMLKDIESLEQYIEEETKVLTDFKTDKRLFLIDYINTEVHGSDWKSKL